VPHDVVSSRLKAVFGGVIIVMKASVGFLHSHEIIPAGSSRVNQPRTARFLVENRSYRKGIVTTGRTGKQKDRDTDCIG
jgi:hypothetical protein